MNSSKVDFNKIVQQKVRSMIAYYQISSARDLERIQATRNSGEAAEDFLKHHATFKLNAPAEKAWDAYKTISPIETWAGQDFDFALLYCPNDQKVYYPSDAKFPSVRVGQSIFIQLNFLKGLVKVPVGQKVIRISDEKMELESSYMECSASRGSQIIRVIPNGPSQSIIEHETWYKSGNWFRDRVLYPPLHLLVISKLHNNIGKYVLQHA